jgi:hypothetical protein
MKKLTLALLAASLLLVAAPARAQEPSPDHFTDRGVETFTERSKAQSAKPQKKTAAKAQKVTYTHRRAKIRGALTSARAVTPQ